MVSDEVIKLLESSDIEMNRLGLAYLKEYYKIKKIKPMHLDKWINYEDFIEKIYNEIFYKSTLAKSIYYNIVEILEKGIRPSVSDTFAIPPIVIIDNPNDFDSNRYFLYSTGIDKAGIVTERKYGYTRIIYDIQANYPIIDKNNIDQFNYNINVKC